MLRHDQVAGLPETKGLEGYRVSVALIDGSRIDDCELVSAGRHGAPTLWLATNGADQFVAHTDVADIWEVPAPPARSRRRT